MNGMAILDAIGEVEDRWILDAGKKTGVAKKLWIGMGSLAACCALVVGLSMNIRQGVDNSLDNWVSDVSPAGVANEDQLHPDYMSVTVSDGNGDTSLSYIPEEQVYDFLEELLMGKALQPVDPALEDWDYCIVLTLAGDAEGKVYYLAGNYLTSPAAGEAVALSREEIQALLEFFGWEG